MVKNSARLPIGWHIVSAITIIAFIGTLIWAFHGIDSEGTMVERCIVVLDSAGEPWKSSMAARQISMSIRAILTASSPLL